MTRVAGRRYTRLRKGGAAEDVQQRADIGRRVAANVRGGAESAALALAGLLALGGLWTAVASQSTPTMLPSPGEVLRALRVDWTLVPALQYLSCRYWAPCRC
jgi:hypothetical protein